jgi:hypothetical protein
MTVSWRSSSGVGSSGTSTITGTLPTGWQAGDLFVAFVYGKHNSAWTISAPPSGWDAVATQRSDNNGANNYRSQLFTRRAVAGDTGPTFSFSLAAAHSIIGIVAVIDGTYLHHNTSFLINPPTNVAQTFPSLTFAAQDAVVLSFLGISRGATTLNVGGTGGFTRDQNLSQGSTGGVQLGSSHKAQTAANASGTNWSSANGADFQQWDIALGSDALARAGQVFLIA